MAGATGFNTSHVTLYRYTIKKKEVHTLVSIHLMLLFISGGVGDGEEKVKFQYISCYSLSRKCLTLCFLNPLFQYISCYSLSPLTSISLTASVAFQYISCYSLSSIAISSEALILCFNTSHVTLYREEISLTNAKEMFQYISCYSLSGRTIHFSTFTYVSIHLMLLFIEHSALDLRYNDQVSIHLMLLFIMGDTDSCLR